MAKLFAAVAPGTPLRSGALESPPSSLCSRSERDTRGSAARGARDGAAAAPEAELHGASRSSPLLHTEHEFLTIAQNRRELGASTQHGMLRTCRSRLRRRLIGAMSRGAARAAAASDAFSHLRPRTVVLITDPGPDPDDTIALLLATSLHLQERIVLAAVICNGGGVHPLTGLKESRNRAALARSILDYFDLRDIPVGIGHQTGTDHRPLQHEYAFPGYAKVDDARLTDAQALLAETLRSVAPRSLTVVVLSALSDVAALVRAHAELVASKVECISVMGGVELEPDGAVRMAAAPVFLRPDQAANNLFDMEAAAHVYSWCVANGVPLRVVSRAAVPNIPMRIVRAFASNNPHDPVLRYLKNASELGLVGLWRRICRGEVPNRDRRWFFLTFCGVSPAEYESLRADELGENFPIARRLDGTVKSYDVVALLLALHDPADEGQELFAFEQACVRIDAQPKRPPVDHYFFVQPTHLAPSNIVIEHLTLVYTFVVSLGKWSVQARLQQARQVLAESGAMLKHLIRQGHNGWVMCGTPCIVNARECICSGSFDGTVRLWDVWTGACVKVLNQGAPRLPGAPALSASDEPSPPVAGSPGPAAAAPAAGARRSTLGALRACVGLGAAPPSVAVPEPTPIASIAKSPSRADTDASLFFYGLNNGSVQVWNVHDDGETSVLVLRDEHHAHPSQVTALLLVDADQSLLSAGGSDDNDRSGGLNEVLQWNLKFSIVVARYRAHTKWIRSLVGSADGRTFYSCSNDGTVCRWPVLPTSTRVARAAAVISPELVIRPRPVPYLAVQDPLRNEWIRSIALTDSGLTLFSAGNDRTLRRWNTQTGEQEKIYLGHENKLACVDVPRGPHPLFVFSGSNDGFIFQWSIARALILTKIECRTAITFINLSTDNLVCTHTRREDGSIAQEFRVRLFSGHYDTTVMMWETSVVVDEQNEPGCSQHAHSAGVLNSARMSLCPSQHSLGRSSPPAARAAPMMPALEGASSADQLLPYTKRLAHDAPRGGAAARADGDGGDVRPSSRRSTAQVAPPGGTDAQCKTMPRSSAVKFSNIPISSVLTATLDGPMVTFSAVLYALSHDTWDATGVAAIRRASDAVMFGIENFVGDSSAFSTFLSIYWVMVGFAALSIVLFVSRAHERCVYALRSVETVYDTDYKNKGATKVVYSTRSGRALYYFERFLVYFIIMLGGAGFFMISRYLLKVIECVDGQWDLQPALPCYAPEHVRYLIISGVLFPFYIVVACRMSASYNDVTYLSQVEGALPPSSRKLRELFTFWGSTVVKRAGWWTRHPVHGWKFGLTGRLSILVNWVADLLIEQQEEMHGSSRWVSVALWLSSAFLLLRLTIAYQPMAEPFSCKVLVVFRGFIVVAYVELAVMNVLNMALVAGGLYGGRDEYLNASRNISMIVWAVATLLSVPLLWRLASRVQWEAGSLTAKQLASMDERRTQLKATDANGGSVSRLLRTRIGSVIGGTPGPGGDRRVSDLPNACGGGALVSRIARKASLGAAMSASSGSSAQVAPHRAPARPARQSDAGRGAGRGAFDAVSPQPSSAIAPASSCAGGMRIVGAVPPIAKLVAPEDDAGTGKPTPTLPSAGARIGPTSAEQGSVAQLGDGGELQGEANAADATEAPPPNAGPLDSATTIAQPPHTPSTRSDGEERGSATSPNVARRGEHAGAA